MNQSGLSPQIADNTLPLDRVSRFENARYVRATLLILRGTCIVKHELCKAQRSPVNVRINWNLQKVKNMTF